MAQQLNEQVLAQAKVLYETTNLSTYKIGQRLNIDRATVSRQAHKKGWKRIVIPLHAAHNPSDNIAAPVKEYIPQDEVYKSRDKAQVLSLKSANERLLKDYSELMEKYDIALSLKVPTTTTITNIKFGISDKNQAIPIIQWSDWHVEEKVEKKTIRGLNEFNPDIARKRVQTLAENTIKLIRKERQDVAINSLYINLGGDFINGYLHEHDTQMNYMSPIEALGFAKDLLKEAILTVAKYSGVKQIDLMCTRGNHTRLTKRMQSSNDYKMNLEAILYHMLKQEIRDSSINWHIPESEYGYIEIEGKIVRAMHGHQINFQGGVGGLTIPMNKHIMNLDKTEKAQYNCISHWHQLSMPTDKCSVNGSLVGYNSYAMSKGFVYQPPLQCFQLLDAKRGFTVRTPIHCE